MYTRVKNAEPTISTVDQEFAWPKIDPDSKAPRFDQIIQSVKGAKPKIGIPGENKRGQHRRFNS